jgi:hypothetical protein
LVDHVAGSYGARAQQQLVCQRRLAVVDVGDDAKVANAVDGDLKWWLLLLFEGCVFWG